MQPYKILFVTPPYHDYNLADQKTYVVEPIQFEVLTSLLDRRRFEVRILDLRLERSQPVYLKTLKEYRPDMVGFTSWTMHVSSVRRLLAQAKSFDSRIVTIVGGHHAGITPSDFADPNIDYVLMGEAYNSFADLMDCIVSGSDCSHLTGVAYQREGRFYSNGATVVTKQFALDDLPFPDRTVLGKYRRKYYHLWWKPIASLRTSMGCPSRCGFCNLWRPNLGKYLTWSPDYIVEYLRTLEEPYVLFVDDHFFGDIKRAYAIGEKILQSGVRKQYCLYSRSDAIAAHPELVELWAKVGLKRVRMGLESYSDVQLDSLTKCNSVENNDTAIAVLKKNGVYTEGLFMIGLDYTEKEFGELAHYITSRKIEVPNITVYTPMPGTTEYEEVREQLRFTDSEYFDFQHATLATKLDIERFCKLYGRLLLKVQRPPHEQIKLIGIKQFVKRMPSFWGYFLAVRNSYRHYRQPPHLTPTTSTLEWLQPKQKQDSSPSAQLVQLAVGRN